MAITPGYDIRIGIIASDFKNAIERAMYGIESFVSPHWYKRWYLLAALWASSRFPKWVSVW